MKKKFNIITLGCRTNQYESQAYRDQLKMLGMEIADDNETEVFIINTCSVTQKAEEASIDKIKNLIKNYPNSQIFITGCLSKEIIEKLKSPENSNVRIISNLEKENLVSEIFPNRIAPKFHIKNFDEHTRAFVKVQDGCNSFCTYCIIPLTRGRSRSRDLESIIKEIEDLIENGYKDIILTGINIGDYKHGDINLAKVIAEIDKLEGLERLRISSIDPNHLDEELCNVIINGKNTTFHMHISLQSGSNRILKRMNRKYEREDFFDTVNKLKSKNFDFTFSTDIIVGFPGETEEDFEDTLEIVKKIKFVKAHIFPFSKRENTPAYNYSDQVPIEVVKRRMKILQEETIKSARELREEFVGRKMWVLLENPKKERPKYISGHTNNFLQVYIPYEERLNSNSFVRVNLLENCDNGLIGEIC